MSTPQDPRNPGEPPRDPGGEPPPDDTQTPRHSPQAPDEPAAAPDTPQPPTTPGIGEQGRSSAEPGRAGAGGPTPGETPAHSEDPPTEYLPKILHRESGTAGSGRTGGEPAPEGPEATAAGSPADDHPTQMLPKPEEPGGAAPWPDKGTAAYTHGWQPGSSEPQPGGGPGGEIPPQAWSARPEEQSPGQAWQPQSPGRSGYSQPGGAPYPGGYGGQPGGVPGQPSGQSGWGRHPGEQSGQGAPEEQSGWNAQPGQQGWGTQSGQGQQGSQPGQQSWGAQPGQQDWGTQPEQQGWGAQPGQQGWGGQPPGGYPAYPQQQYQPYGATQQPERSGPQVLSIIGFVCAAVSLLFCPLVFGIAGIILGVVGHIRGESLGKWAAIAAAVCLAAGILLAWALYGMDLVPVESAR